ncbi:MAG: hypothetical protein LC775_14400, partial [Acidobacteria bacterium]|nr:hypothetical protein [Acidobacteriota bacterium]
MKLCPQCEFIYENEQSVCDMDGNELVYDSGPLALQDNASSRTQGLHERPANPVRLTVDFPVGQPSRWQSKGSAVVALAAIIFAALLFAVYYARTHQPRSANANQASSQTAIQSSDRATQLATAAEESKPDDETAPLTP